MQHVKHVTLALQPHSRTGPEPCALCGNETEPRTPIDLFLAGTSELVCNHCAGKYAPELVWLMDYSYRGHYVEADYDEIEAQLRAQSGTLPHTWSRKTWWLWSRTCRAWSTVPPG